MNNTTPCSIKDASYIFPNIKRENWTSYCKDVVRIVNGFELTGIIKRGQEKNRESSYEFTDFGTELITQYAQLDKNYQPTLFGKIQNFINRILAKNNRLIDFSIRTKI